MILLSITGLFKCSIGESRLSAARYRIISLYNATRSTHYNRITWKCTFYNRICSNNAMMAYSGTLQDRSLSFFSSLVAGCFHPTESHPTPLFYSNLSELFLYNENIFFISIKLISKSLAIQNA